MVTEEQVLDSMRHIIDPDLGKDIVSLGFIKNITIEGGRVRFTVELTTPACPVKEEFRHKCKEAVEALEGVEAVEVELSSMKPRQKTEQPSTILPGIDAVVAVSACKGGVGKSTVAAQLARRMQDEGLAVGLLDADVYGPSVPTLFDLHNPQLYSDGTNLLPVELDGLKIMSLGFLLGESPAVLRGPIVSNYIRQVLHQTNWGELDYLIIDLPPGTGDIQLTVVQQVALDGAIIVTTPQALSLVDVSRGILMFEKVNVPVLGVVENMSYFDCTECGARHYPFGSSAQSLQSRFGLTNLAELPITPGVSDLTKPENRLPVFHDLADNLHRAVGTRRADALPRPQASAQPGHIHILWPDGSESQLPNRHVRGNCRCALCVDENSGQRIVGVDQIPEDIQAESVAPLGNYAVSIAWSDGHTTGIYSWEHLRDLAQALEAE
ncbi:MAG: P-loop NTPase [Candidatus Hydrogenedentota bacterium]